MYTYIYMYVCMSTTRIDKYVKKSTFWYISTYIYMFVIVVSSIKNTCGVHSSQIDRSRTCPVYISEHIPFQTFWSLCTNGREGSQWKQRKPHIAALICGHIGPFFSCSRLLLLFRIKVAFNFAPRNSTQGTSAIKI